MKARVLPPQLLEACRLGGGVPHCVLNVPMAELILDEPGVGPLVGQGEAASMAQHLGMHQEGQGGGLAASVGCWGLTEHYAELGIMFRCSRIPDYAAVKAGVTLPWSSGPVERHINRLKMLKRQMFDRARLDLLSRRFVLAPRGKQTRTADPYAPSLAYAETEAV